MLRLTIDTGCDQDIGISRYHHTQEDRIRVEKVRMASGLEPIVGVVVDGESPYGQGERAAKRTMSRIYRSLQEAEGKDIHRSLEDALRRAHSALHQEINRDGRADLMAASVTAVVIDQKKLYLAHAGNTRAYLVRGEEVVQLTRDHVRNNRGGYILSKAVGLNTNLSPDLGAHPERDVPWISNGNAVSLKRGDHVVLCSDGLIKDRPDKPGKLLDPEIEMPPVLNDPNTPALEAARTLVSRAVGRNADDNVSAGVISLMRTRFNPILLLGLGVLMAAMVLLAGLFLPDSPATDTIPTLSKSHTPIPSPTLTPTPLPIRVGLSKGSVDLSKDGESWTPFRPNDAINAGYAIRTGTNGQAKLILRDGSQVYLEPSSQLTIFQIADAYPNDSTLLMLDQGQVLLHQPNLEGKTLSIRMPEQGQAILQGYGALAASYDPGEQETRVECLNGSSCKLGAKPIVPGWNARQTDSGQVELQLIQLDERYDQYVEWNRSCKCIKDSLLSEGATNP